MAKDVDKNVNIKKKDACTTKENIILVKQNYVENKLWQKTYIFLNKQYFVLYACIHTCAKTFTTFNLNCSWIDHHFGIYHNHLIYWMQNDKNVKKLQWLQLTLEMLTCEFVSEEYFFPKITNHPGIFKQLQQTLF